MNAAAALLAPLGFKPTTTGGNNFAFAKEDAAGFTETLITDGEDPGAEILSSDRPVFVGIYLRSDGAPVLQLGFPTLAAFLAATDAYEF